MFDIFISMYFASNWNCYLCNMPKTLFQFMVLDNDAREDEGGNPHNKCT